MYRVEIIGVLAGSEWDLQPWALPTEDAMLDHVFGICRSILAWRDSGEPTPPDLVILVTGPNDFLVKWPLSAAVAIGCMSQLPGNI